MLVPAQQLILLGWAVLILALLGCGGAVRRLFGWPIRRAADFWLTFWLGWCSILAFLQIWHIFRPVDEQAQLVVGITAAAGVLLTGWRAWALLPRVALRYWPVLLLLLPAAIWLSNWSMQGPIFGDTGLYFVPTIHWYESYPAVPGLANLFVPLGHNFSYFLWAALVGFGPFARAPYHIVNSVLVLVILARILLALVRLLRRRSPQLAVDLFYLLTLPAMIEFVVGVFLTSPTPDSAVWLVGFVLSGELVGMLTQRLPQRGALLALVFIAAVGVTLKTSIALLGATSVTVAFLWWIWKRRPGWRQAFATLIAALLLGALPIGTWVVRNVIVSGKPLYPSALITLDVPWRSKIDAVEWIQRPMQLAPVSVLLSQPRWFGRRLLSLGWGDVEVIEPAVVLGLGLLLIALLRPWRWWQNRKESELAEPSSRPSARLPALVLLAPLVSFVFCFLSVPMPRYQGATIWILAIEMVLIGLSGSVRETRRGGRALVVVLVLAAVCVPLARKPIWWQRLRQLPPTNLPHVALKELPSGLRLNVPDETQACWWAELPCTPEPHPSLRLRDPNNLGAGFEITEN